MLMRFFRTMRLSRRFSDYRWNKVTRSAISQWIQQYPKDLQDSLLDLLEAVIFIRESEARDTLLRLNEKILEDLAADGIDIGNVVYVQVDDAGSSSPVVLNLLRDHANLSRRGAKFVDSHAERRVNDTTASIGTGALVYVDDFAGSGTQFIRNHKRMSEFVVGNFSEFVLTVAMAEEAFGAFSDIGVVPVTGRIHKKSERPLHDSSNQWPSAKKQALIDLCRSINKRGGLGFKRLATMVVLYRNAPNSTPLVLRGDLGQRPRRGILPRSDDLQM